MNNDATVTTYFESAGALLTAGLANMKRADPDGYRAVHEAVSAGAMVQLVTGVNRTGIVELRCTLGMGDEQVTLFSIDAQKPLPN